MRDLYYLHDKIIMRTPNSPVSNITNLDEKSILTFFSQPKHQEALYLASPSLFESLQKFLTNGEKDDKKRRKLMYALYKYYIRMCTRSTPFGLFASIGTVGWTKEETSIQIDKEKKTKHARYDMFFLCELIQKLEQNPAVYENLKYYSNNSIYSFQDEFRYIEYETRQGTRFHQINSIGRNDYLDEILEFCQDGVLFQDVISSLIDDDISEEEAKAYIKELIDSQILVSELTPSLLSYNVLDDIIIVLERINETIDSVSLNQIFSQLKILNRQLLAVNEKDAGHVDLYKDIYNNCRKVIEEIAENKILHLDSADLNISGGINDSIKFQIFETIDLLSKMSTFIPSEQFKTFKENFIDKYENEEVPLLEVIDDDIGIGFGASKDDNDLTKNVRIIDSSRQEIQTTKWDGLNRVLLGKLIQSEKEGVIKFHKKDFAHLKSNWENLPPSFSVIFRICGDKILLETVGNSSATKLLGRFGFISKDIRETLIDIANAEQRINDVIFAEVLHLPSNRVGNILSRPNIRGYEIPFLLSPSKTDNIQIPVSDILVSVRGGKIIIRSKKLGKQIIPQLSSAHNYNFYTQPVYKFLCDLQTQDFIYWITFNYGNLGNQMMFLPRVEYKNVILQRARWQLLKEDYRSLINNYSQKELKKFKELYKIPDKFYLIKDDYEMLIDLNSTLSVNTFISSIKNAGNITLKESLINEQTEIVRDLNNNAYLNQFICSLIKKEPVYQKIYFSEREISSEKRFFPISNWSYYKIYCSSKSSNLILTEAIQPLVKILLEKNIISKFFFIRYNDPHDHIRFRVYLNDVKYINELNVLFNKAVDPFIKNKNIWKIQIDTYSREIERYGSNTIEESETFFHNDSMGILSIIAGTEYKTSWLLSLLIIDTILNEFNISLKDKLGLFKHLKESYYKEFGINSNANRSISKGYEGDKKEIAQFIATRKDDPLIKFYKDAAGKLASSIYEKKELGLFTLNTSAYLASIIHMHLNRLFTSNQRKHELILYDYLYKYYITQLKRKENDILLSK